MSKRGKSPLSGIDKKQKIEECLTTISTDDDQRCFERIAKLVDNRHDFKPAGRNQSIDNTMVLRILNDFKDELKNHKPTDETNKQIYNNLLAIHCSDYISECKKTTINIDKDAEHQYESYFNQTLKLSSSIPEVSWNEFTINTQLTNHVKVIIGDKKQLHRLLPTKESSKNDFLETLMSRMTQYLGKERKDINSVIDTCALSELAFTTFIDKEKEAQTDLKEAIKHSRIYIGNGTDLDIFNRALPGIGNTSLRYLIVQIQKLVKIPTI